MTYSMPLFCPATGVEVFDLGCQGDNKPTVRHGITKASQGFKGTSAAKSGYKIYVAVNADGVQYVGCTCTSMSSRLNMGHRRHKEPKNGYHGYKWLALDNLKLYVFYLKGLSHPTPKAAPGVLTSKLIAERIEAELVYAVRAATGQWPLSQHEIHFHNLADEPALAALTTVIAQQLYTELNRVLAH